tara:strand:- start:38060 stop:39196 length:1137 start_codon:yes stop_codon:yes gene_type:complete
MFRKIILITICLISFSSYAKHVTLVESVPLNTIYGQKDIPQTEPTWLNLIKHAHSSIDIGAFYLNTARHSSMEKVIHALKAAANRGVKVNILLDKLFKSQSATAVGELKQNKKIHIRYVDIKKLTGGVMHAKYMIIDRRYTFIGSQNFDWKAINQNHEIGVLIDNTAIAKTVTAVFNIDWTGHIPKRLQFKPVTHQHPVKLDGATLYPAFSPVKLIPHALDWELPRLLDLIDAAHTNIDVQLYQYSDFSTYKSHRHWYLIDDALVKAAKRGVKVHMIVSDVMRGKRALKALKKLERYKNIRIKVSHVPAYKGRNMPYGRVEHAKFMVVDDNIIWIGTGNWSKDYFYNSRDMAVVVNDKHLNTQLTRVFQQDWNGPYTK